LAVTVGRLGVPGARGPCAGQGFHGREPSLRPGTIEARRSQRLYPTSQE